jgi:hypothetical protein
VLEFLLVPQNKPFAVAIAIMFAIAALEVLSTLMGAGLSRMIDSLLPDSLGDIDLDADADIDADVDTDIDADIDTDVDAGVAHGGGGSGGDFALSVLLGWLCIGQVPILILAIIFLTVFGLSGLLLQGISSSVTGGLLPGGLISFPAAVVGIGGVRVFGRMFARLIPTVQSSAVSKRSFIGRIATITLGTARPNAPTQGKLYDSYGQAHYVMIEPDEDDVFETGDQVLIVSQRGATYRAIRNTSSALVDS